MNNTPIPIDSTDRHEHVEVARLPNGNVNEIYVYANETYTEKDETWHYTLTIIRVGGLPLTDEEIADLVAKAGA